MVQSNTKVGCRDDEILSMAVECYPPIIDVRTAEDHPNTRCSIVYLSLISLDEREWSSEAPRDIRTEWNVRTTGTTTYSLTYVDPGTAPTR